jgi:beta-glucosidase
MGKALGREAIEVGCNVILGPGTNIKRNPLCGRNFEYFSEDPFLSGKLSAAWIKGVQSTGTGVSLKHFALNNQENKRMSTNVLVNERALREYYLPAFEIAVKESKPTTLMCAYNKVQGIYCSDNKRLIWDILREEWGFDGAVITDWGATNDRIEAFKAGLDLEMPGSKGRFDKDVKDAVEKGELDEAFIDASVDRLLTLIDRTTQRKRVIDKELFSQNHELARRVAVASGVLLKNCDGILPLEKFESVAVIGELARKPRYQGSGSSQVTPTNLIPLLDGVKSYSNTVNFAAGYTIQDRVDERLLFEAVKVAEHSKVVVLCLGLTDIFESEGFDRDHMRIPQNQISLLEAIAEVNSNIIIVLVGGSAIEMDWEKYAKGILHMQLSGQAGGIAAADLLFGEECPSGKLTESYPYLYKDFVNSSYYHLEPKQTPYLESMFCGYRYFNSAGVPVRYPFGYGLSYSSFSYSDLKVIKKNNDQIELTCTIKNTGDYNAAEIAQVYVKANTNGVYRPTRELKSFAKVYLKKGESKQIHFTLDKRSFAIYDVTTNDWVVESGDYLIQIGVNVEDICLEETLTLEGVMPSKDRCSEWYYTLKGVPNKEDFVSVYGNVDDYIPLTKGSYDMTSSIKEMKETSFLCKIMYKGMEWGIAKQAGGKVDYDNPSFKMLMDSASDNPMKSMPLFSPDFMPVNRAAFFVDWANGKKLKAIKKLFNNK